MVEQISHCYLGLDLTQYHGLVLDLYVNKLRSGHFRWPLPIEIFKGHAFLRYKGPSAFYTWREMTLSNLHLFHPYSNKPFKLFRRSDPSKATTEVKKVLDNITVACNEL